MRVKSNLKVILDEKGMSISQCAKECELPKETVRRLYNDSTMQYQRDTIGKLCKKLNIKLSDLLILVED